MKRAVFSTLVLSLGVVAAPPLVRASESTPTSESEVEQLLGEDAEVLEQLSTGFSAETMAALFSSLGIHLDTDITDAVKVAEGQIDLSKFASEFFEKMHTALTSNKALQEFLGQMEGPEDLRDLFEKLKRLTKEGGSDPEQVEEILLEARDATEGEAGSVNTTVDA
ncbi:hypothetical protein BESB_072020 [Besnoitia besnoiti]|uniref:Uncharacterized protein n=1 Tax=Besnoitia besnoiti TaxID=94643 RepID=A0A2A9MF99_BESBE|nr:uncharacterized protein BESB_072020 [Besnoitia besnoiti]PFH34050.1 hypothetical protein BESB_072020 [Besnoitia besnoiti]